MSTDDTLEIEQYMDDLEREAQSDGPHAWVAERILQNLDSEDDS